MLKSIAILYHPFREAAISAAEHLAAELKSQGVDTYKGPAFDGDPIREHVAGRDLTICLGGDGTILAVGRETVGAGVPTLGVNLGRVGFLAELTPEGLEEALPRILAGDFWVESRCCLEAAWVTDGVPQRHIALNEVALARGTSTRAIQVVTKVDGSHYTTLTVDAVLVSTATGSTAYSLAAGGPIMYPECTDLLLTPVAPHLHIARSLILPGSAEVTLELHEEKEAMLAIDSQTERPFGAGECVTIRRSQQHALFARLGSRGYFYSVLSQRFR